MNPNMNNYVGPSPSDESTGGQTQKTASSEEGVGVGLRYLARGSTKRWSRWGVHGQAMRKLQQ
jgi:hypothetical protein